LLNLDKPAYLRKKYGSTAWTPFVKNPKQKRNGKESNMANYDQSDYSNIKMLSGSILCMSITPPEKPMMASASSRRMNNLFATHMSMARQAVMADKNNSSFKEFMGEYHYACLQDTVQGDSKIIFAKNNSDLRRIVDEGGVALVMTAEGGHVLFGNDVLSDIDSLKSKDCGPLCRAEIFKNIETLRNLEHRMFFLTVSHFAWNKMFGNAKSLDKPGLRRVLLTTASFTDNFKKNMFAKYAEGIVQNVHSLDYKDTLIHIAGITKKIKTPYSADEYQTDMGMSVLLKLLDAEHDYKQPIYIDVKHMDIKARFEYYQFIDSLNDIRKSEHKQLIPIIASHIGMNGKHRAAAMATALYPLNDSYEELIFGRTFYKLQLTEKDSYWRAYTASLKPADRAMYFGTSAANTPAYFNPFEGTANFNTLGWFYPWGINFCDEEIQHIYKSDGIIGLNMDRRILGFTMQNYNWRYKTHLRRMFNAIYKNEVAIDGITLKFEDYYRCEPLIRTMLHIVSVCGASDATAWDHIAIGSDYDGFIQPVKTVPSAEYMPFFHKQMVVFFKIYTELHNQQGLMYGLSAKDIMQKFFYSNGARFTMKYFQQ